jgi:hypothetical protein
MFKGMDPVPADLKPVASGSVLPWSVFLYRYGDEFATCTTVLNDGAPQPSGASTGQSWLPLPQGRHFESFAGSLTTDMSAGDIGAGDAGGKVLDGVSAFLVSDDVARLVLHVGDEDIKATVTNGLALCRLPGGELMSDYEASTITAYDADGHELETLALLDSLPPDGD